MQFIYMHILSVNIFYIFLNFMSMGGEGSVWVNVMCMCLLKPEEGIMALGTRVPNGYERPGMGARTHTQFSGRVAIFLTLYTFIFILFNKIM